MRRHRPDDIANASAKRSTLTSVGDGARPKRCGDAGRRASMARAQRYVIGMMPLLEAIMRDQGRSAQAVATELTRRAVQKPRGGVIWTSADAQRLLRRSSIGREVHRPGGQAGDGAPASRRGVAVARSDG
jgi:hypothetical protein